MRIFFSVMATMIINIAVANPTPQANPPPVKTQTQKPKMTTSEAKELCKLEGKTGQALIQCLQDKQAASR